MASSELHDVVSTVDERSRKTRGCPTAYRRRFRYRFRPSLELMPSRVCWGDRIRQRLTARPYSRGSFADHAIARSAQILEDALAIARVVGCKARQR